MDRGDQSVLDDVRLGIADPTSSSILRLGPPDFDERSDPPRSRPRFHDRRLHPSGQELVDASDDAIAVTAERLAVGILTPGRSLSEEGAKSIEVPVVERGHETRCELLIHDTMVPVLACPRAQSVPGLDLPLVTLVVTPSQGSALRLTRRERRLERQESTMVLSWIFGVGGVLLLLAAIVYVWRNRPYRGPGAEEDTAWREEAALQADAFVNRSANM